LNTAAEKTGDLVFVRVQMTISQLGAVCIEEEQTIVYRAAGARVPPVQVVTRAALKDGEKSQEWTPSTVELFRYSSLPILTVSITIGNTRLRRKAIRSGRMGH
jgi:3-methylfumaryl-CoA hydratase